MQPQSYLLRGSLLSDLCVEELVQVVVKVLVGEGRVVG